jgi:hypothetical protein
MGRIRSWPAFTVLARLGLCSTCGPQLLRQRPTAVRPGGPRTLGNVACTLDGGVHARWRGDFTNVGGWPATRLERRCSTRTERRPQWWCLPARRQTGWRRGWGRRRAPAQLAATRRLNDLRGGRRGCESCLEGGVNRQSTLKLT